MSQVRSGPGRVREVRMNAFMTAGSRPLYGAKGQSVPVVGDGSRFYASPRWQHPRPHSPNSSTGATLEKPWLADTKISTADQSGRRAQNVRSQLRGVFHVQKTYSGAQP